VVSGQWLEEERSVVKLTADFFEKCFTVESGFPEISGTNERFRGLILINQS
jgi:hypothetical protein